MTLMHRMLSFVEQVRAAAHVRELGQAVQDLAEGHGYEGTVIIDPEELVRRVGPAILFMTEPLDRAQQRDRTYPFVQRPVCVGANTTRRSFLTTWGVNWALMRRRGRTRYRRICASRSRCFCPFTGTRNWLGTWLAAGRNRIDRSWG